MNICDTCQQRYSCFLQTGISAEKCAMYIPLTAEQQLDRDIRKINYKIAVGMIAIADGWNHIQNLMSNRNVIRKE